MTAMYQKDGRMWSEIGDAGFGPEYVLSSPPIPTDTSSFLNDQVKEKRKQKFEHTHLPTRATYYAWPRERQQELEDQEWHRRKSGVWFWNNGVPTWITGQHYFYLNYHRYGPKTKPEYRDANRKFYWVWRHVLRSKNCLGLFIHTRRRDGKTSRAANIGVEATTRIEGFKFGMQSKTGQSASVSIYQNEVLPCVKALWDCPWFMPSLKGKIDPSNNLWFAAQSTTARRKVDGPTYSGLEDLQSYILWADSPPNALDSNGMGYYLNDECAKDQLHNPYRRWTTVARMFEPNGVIIGKGICATTTDEEDIDEETGKRKTARAKDKTSVALAIKFWETSDHTKLKPGERTESGMFRLFVGGSEGLLVDEYGMDTAAGLEEIMNKRRNKKGLAYLNEVRANPLTIAEAHMDDADEECPFNVEHIQDNVDAIQEWETEHGKPLCPRYKLHWADEEKKLPPVRAERDQKGDWSFPWLPRTEELNQVVVTGYKDTKNGYLPTYEPRNLIDYSMGTDPIQKKLSRVVNKKKASMAAAYVFRQHDDFNEAHPGAPDYWPSHAFIGRYYGRPENPEDYYDEMMKGCHLFGTEIHGERQTFEPLIQYFEDWGREEFLANKARTTEGPSQQGDEQVGTAASPGTQFRWQTLEEQFVISFVGSRHTVNSKGKIGVNDQGVRFDFRRQPFLALHLCNKKFNPSKTQVNDDTVAEGFTLLHVFRRTRETRSNSMAKAAATMYGLMNPDLYFRR